MFVLSQSSGSFPVSMDAWKMVAIAGASWGAQVFNMMLAIWSGPWALDVLIPRSSFLTPSTVMRSAGIGCLALFLVSGRWLLLSLVKTDWNCSTIICAFSLLALISCPIFFKGGTPTLSWRLDLTYLQNGLELFSSSPFWMTSLMWLISALLKAFLQSFWNDLNELQWFDFFARLYNLDLCHTIFFKLLLNQGKDFLSEQTLDVISSHSYSWHIIIQSSNQFIKLILIILCQ